MKQTLTAIFALSGAIFTERGRGMKKRPYVTQQTVRMTLAIADRIRAIGVVDTADLRQLGGFIAALTDGPEEATLDVTDYVRAPVAK